MKAQTKSQIIDLKRRNILKQSLFGLSAIAAAAIVSPNKVFAEDGLPKLEEDDPMAIGVGYKHNANEVDIVKYPKRAGEEGAKQFCENCALYSGEKDAESGKCAIFPGKLVNAKGWCSAWAPKA